MKYTSNRFVLLFSVLAGLQVLAGAAALGDVIGATAFGLFVVAIGAVQTGATFYVNNQITPTANVVAVASADGLSATAGPAADVFTGTLVDVIPANPPLHDFDHGRDKI